MNSFYSFVEIDTRAIAAITNCCPNLVTFGLHNCEFLETDEDINEANGVVRDVDVDGPFRNADRLARLAEERETLKLVVPLLDLDVIKIVSHCPSRYLNFVLGQCCFNVREIFIGMSTGISDDVVFKVLAENRLSKLEKLTIQGSMF